MTPGQFVFAPDGTPHFPGFHNLGSAIWTTDLERTEDTLGEVVGERFGWHNGALPAIVPDPIRIGSFDCIAQGEQIECADPYDFVAEGGATWSSAGDALRLDFEDSVNCGGSDPAPQFGSVKIAVTLFTPRELTATLTGRVERENEGFDIGRILVDGHLLCELQGTGEHLGCAMADLTRSASMALDAGEHLVELVGNTVDELFHVGAYFEYLVSLAPPIAGNPNPFKLGFDARCFLPVPAQPPAPPTFPDVFDRAHQIIFAQALDLQYTSPPAAQAKLDELLGTPVKTYSAPNNATALPSLCLAQYAQCNVVLVSGTTNDMQWALQGMGSILGPRRFVAYATSPFWIEQQQIMMRIIFAFNFDLALPFVFCGHSYGGVLCTLSVADYVLAAPTRDIQLLTFGMPRPGDQRLADVLRFARSCHFARDDDPVPGLPPTGPELSALFEAIPRAWFNSWFPWRSPPGCRVLHADGQDDEGTPPGAGITILRTIAAQVLAGDPVGPFAGHLIPAYVAWLTA